jgi:hypothetical protein
MKYIEKGKEPIEFTNWKKKKNSKWTPSFGDLSGKEKLAVLNALKREQGFICCYCERSLESIDSHIEHFVPQNKGYYSATILGNKLNISNTFLEFFMVVSIMERKTANR